MKKRFLSVALAAQLTAHGFAQTVAAVGKFTPQEQAKCNLALLSRLDQLSRHGAVMARGTQSQVEPQIKVMVEMQEGETADVLLQYGVQIKAQYANFASLSVTPSQVAHVGADSRVAELSLPGKSQVFLAHAGRYSGVDRAHAGEALQQPYTGKGVLALICDVGFQVDHPMMKRQDGSLKTELFIDKEGRQYTTESEIKSIAPSSESYGHGTHTSSIFVGEAVKGTDGLVYQGVAPGASIAMSDAHIEDDSEVMERISDLVKYAELPENQGRPKVMSLSLGTMSTAWTDGPDVYAKMLNKMAEKIPVCICVGNDGDCLTDYVFSDTCTVSRHKFKMKPAIRVAGTEQADFYFATSDQKPIKCTFYICDKKLNVVAKLPTLTGLTNGSSISISSLAEDAGKEGVIIDDAFAQHFKGRISYSSKIAENGCYQALIHYDGADLLNQDYPYQLYLVVEGEEGQFIKGSGDESDNSRLNFLDFDDYPELDGAELPMQSIVDGQVTTLHWPTTLSLWAHTTMSPRMRILTAT